MPATEVEARKFLADLREEILRHPGVGHSLLGRMNMDPRSRFDFKILASQHFAQWRNQREHFRAHDGALSHVDNTVRATLTEPKCDAATHARGMERGAAATVRG